MICKLPAFSFDDYATLLDQLKSVGYRFDLISNMKQVDPEARIVFLRHDIDLHIDGIEEMVTLEAARDVKATYFIPLTLHFNPLYPQNQRILGQIVDLGHEIGLHYDMETYPVDPEGARRHLEWEVGILSKIIGRQVCTICMHQPHKGRSDPFRDIDEYINPNDLRYQKDLLYISDSCRAWRDEELLRCFGPKAPRHLILATHPELWLDGSVIDRMDYLNNVLTVNGARQHKDYFNQSVRQIWLTHPAPKLHDQRESSKTKLGENGA